MQTKPLFILAVLGLVICGFLCVYGSAKAQNAQSLSGRILLQVEEHGQAWYVDPVSGKRHYLGRPAEAFAIMQNLSLGAAHDFITRTETFPARLSGRILLDVEANGEAYYIYPPDRRKYYLGRPADAFRIMRELGLGITNHDLARIPSADPDKSPESSRPEEKLIHNVPFTPQAPFGEWSDQRQQDGCEEASALMTVKWARNKDLSRADALSAIINISDYLQKKYGEYRDISLADTRDWIFKDYFGHTKVELKKNIRIPDMIKELADGNVLVVAMNGRKLGNPNFTPPGPSRHMVLVRGYDREREVFVTNDPGTRNGELYEYDFNVFYEAIRDYPTGYHEPISKVRKDMLVVGK